MYKQIGEDSNILLLCLYVDDILVMGSSLTIVDKFKENMMHKFEMTDLRLLHYFLGLEVKQQLGLILNSQKKYAETLLKKFNMMNSKSQSTPLNANEKLQSEDNLGKADENRFGSIVGSLLYLTHTHLELMFAM